MSETEPPAAGHDRRTFLRAAAAAGGVAMAGGTLLACGGEGGSSTDVAPAGTELGSASEVEVEGARIYPDANVLVSQPTAGEFKAFSAICTHQGCVLGEVSGDVAICPCHNSKFSITDGSVVNGPATEALPAQSVRVEAGSLVVG